MPPRLPQPRAGLISALGGAVIVAAVFLLTLGDATRAEAQAAKIESQTRPDFGLLLSPPPRSSRPYSYGRDRPLRWRDHHPDWRDDDGHWRGRPDDVAMVDCAAQSGPYELQRAVRHLRPGGTLILRGRGAACTTWLDIDRSLTIIGDADVDYASLTDSSPAGIQAPAGQPCITVSPGVRLELRDVILESSAAGDAPCVVGYDAEIIMRRSAVRYTGDGPAVFADGGLLDLRDTVVSAATRGPGIAAFGGGLTAHRLRVSGATIGIEVTPGAGQSASLSEVILLAGQRAEGFGPRALGVLLRGARDTSRVAISNAVICGYDEGVSIDGAFVDVTDSLICMSRKGAVVYSGDLAIQRSSIGAEDVSVAVGQGRARVIDNSLFGVRQLPVYYAERGAWLEASGNVVYSQHLCRPYRQERTGWRNRGRFDWYGPSGDGWECAYGQGSREFYDRGEWMMGREFYEYAYPWEGYEAYRGGAGWYDDADRYVPGY